MTRNKWWSPYQSPSAQMRFWGGNNPKICENGWFWPFFLLTGGGEVGGQSLRLGGICPHAPLDAATVHSADSVIGLWTLKLSLNSLHPTCPMYAFNKVSVWSTGSNYTYTGYRGHCLPLLGLGLDAFWPLSIFWAFFITSWPCSHVVTLPSNENPSSSPGALMPKGLWITYAVGGGRKCFADFLNFFIRFSIGLGESGANWHPTCFCSRGCCQPMAMMFLCYTYTNQYTKNLWRPNPSWFKNDHDKPFLNHMSILFNNSYFVFSSLCCLSGGSF